MIVSHKHKFIFIRVPKTGSTTITTVLNENHEVFLYNGFAIHEKYVNKIDKAKQDYIKKIKKKLGKEVGGNHIQTKFIKHFLPEHNDYFKFSFVRNPYERLVSRFEWKATNGILTIKSDKQFTFNEYIRKFEETGFDSFRTPQYEFTKGCDYIGKTENLQEDFNTICNKIGIPRQELPHKNTSKHKHYTEYYDDETREIVAEKYAKDIEYFNYQFGE